MRRARGPSAATDSRSPSNSAEWRRRRPAISFRHAPPGAVAPSIRSSDRAAARKGSDMTLALILKIIAGLGGVTGVTNLAASLVKSLSKGGWKTVLGKAGAAAGGAALASSFGFNP